MMGWFTHWTNVAVASGGSATAAVVPRNASVFSSSARPTSLP